MVRGVTRAISTTHRRKKGNLLGLGKARGSEWLRAILVREQERVEEGKLPKERSQGLKRIEKKGSLEGKGQVPVMQSTLETKIYPPQLSLSFYLRKHDPNDDDAMAGGSSLTPFLQFTRIGSPDVQIQLPESIDDPSSC